MSHTSPASSRLAFSSFRQLPDGKSPKRLPRWPFYLLIAIVMLSTGLYSLAQTNLLVTNTNDSGEGSLRQAIIDANNTAGTQTISFNIPGSGVQTITPVSPLPSITDPVVIDGTTQPGFAGMPLIELNGASAGASATGIFIVAGNSTIRGLAINRFAFSGIFMGTGGGNIIEGNFVGTDPTGTIARGNNGVAILATNSANNRIGGTSPAQRNLISGNNFNSLGLSQSGSIGNVVQGNYIGTDVTGTVALGNALPVAIDRGSSDNTIGGTAPGAGNLISGNRGNGVSIFLSATNNRVQGNLIGTNAAGTAALPNGNAGVTISDASTNNLIGGAVAGARNIISGNNGTGISIGGGATNATTTGNVVQGNFIGTDVTGTQALGNVTGGLDIFAVNSTIGGTTTGARNVISANGGTGGITIFGSDATGNLVQGNFIGTQANGSSPLGTQAAGVLIANNPQNNNTPINNTVGGTAGGAGNVIAFNLTGVRVSSGAGNAVLSNSIHSNGTTNLHLGIDLGGTGVNANDAGDGDTGANTLQNFPVLASATVSDGTTTITGTLNSTASTAFTIQFFSNPTCDASGNGEGQTFLGSTSVTTDGAGNAAINATLGGAVTVGQVVTATTTNPNGNTSEFSVCVPVMPPPTFTIGGRVADGANNPLSGVTVTLSGTQTGTTTTDASGNYSFANLAAGGTYTVTPTLANFTFNPANASFSNLQTNQTANFTGTSAQVCVAPPANMVAWYPGDGNARDIQGGNNGTLQGNTTFAPGKVGQTFRLDGNGDRVLISNQASLQLQNFTIDGWIRRASSTVVTNDGRPGVEGGAFFAYGSGGYGFLIDQATNRIGLTRVEVSNVFSTSTITDTNFHHVAVTKSGNQVTFYIDGVADAPVTYDPGFTFTTDAAIGARGDSDLQNAFFGDVDELEIFNRALSQTEIQSIVNAGSAGKCKTQGGTSILTFPTSSNGEVNDPNYGDRFPGTPNVVVDYGPAGAAPRRWTTQYGDLVGVLYEENDGFGILEITFVADPGFLVTLSSFDMGAWPDTDRTINSVQVIDVESNTMLFSQNNVLIQGDFNGPRHTTFNFPTPLTARVLRIRFDAGNLGGSSDDVGIDNIVFSQVTGSQPACTPPPPNMVAWYPGDGNANDIQGGNNGTISGGTAFVPGKVAAAFNFDGTGGVTIADAGILKPPTFSIDAWIKPNFANRPRLSFDVDSVFIKFDGNSNGYGLFILQDPNVTFGGNSGPLPRGTINLSANINGSVQAANSAIVVPDDGAYHHVAGTYDGSSLKVYLDGVLVGERAAAGAIVHTNAAATIGFTNAFVTRNSIAAIDEVEVFNRVLSQTEIQSIVNAGSAGKCKTQPQTFTISGRVAGGANLALNRPAEQSSVGFNGPANLAVDGNTDGNYFNGSSSHTNFENQPWWQVDLGSVQAIQSIRVWNRTDCCLERLSNFHVLVSDTPFNTNDLSTLLAQPGVSSFLTEGQGGRPTSIAINRTGRFVRVQLAGSNFLTLSEVEVFGTSGFTTGISNVTLALSGSQSATTTTDANGNYSFPNLAAGGNYTVTPTLANFTFTPPNQTFNNLQANQTANFVGTSSGGINFVTISGRVSDTGGNSLGGVAVTLLNEDANQVLTTTTDTGGNYSFTVPDGSDYTVTPLSNGFTFDPSFRTFLNLSGSQVGNFVGTGALTITGQIANLAPGQIVTVVLSGTRSGVTTTDANGNYSFAGLPVGGDYTVTPLSSEQVFNPSSVIVNNLNNNMTTNFMAAANPNPTPTPPIVEGFEGATRDPLKFSEGTLTQPPGSTDPQVTVVQRNGQLVITPRAGITDASFNGYVTTRAIDFTNATAAVEVVQTADNGAQTIFGIGSSSENFFRFIAQDADPDPGTGTAAGKAGNIALAESPLRQLIFQVRQAGVLNALAIPYDPVQHRFWRFRHDAVNSPATMNFETSPTGLEGTYTVRFLRVLGGPIGSLAIELAAGTAGAVSNPGQAIFDNLDVQPQRAAALLGTFSFAAGTIINVDEGVGSLRIKVRRTGSTTPEAAVEVASEPFDNQPCNTVDGKARPRCDYSTTVARLRFAPGEVEKTVTIFITDDSYQEGVESFRLALGNSTGGYTVEEPLAIIRITDNDAVAGPNPINTAPFLVRQQYLDFLYREPEADGFQAWVGVLQNCAFEGHFGPGKSGSDPNCDRITVSSSFFRSKEFQIKGYFVYRFYRASLGRQPTYEEFLLDITSISGQTDAEVNARLEAFAGEWVKRADFKAIYDPLSNQGYVDKLVQTAGVTLTNRGQLISDLGAGRRTRAEVLRVVVDSAELFNREYNAAFVLMQYFGYLQRDPDLAGYQRWLNFLNASGDFRTMIFGFLYSQEYQSRYGAP